MSPDDRWRVAHMVEAADQALAFVAGRDRADLDTDAMLRLGADSGPRATVALLFLFAFLATSNAEGIRLASPYEIKVTPTSPTDIDLVTIAFGKACGGLIAKDITYFLTDENEINIFYRTTCADFTSMPIEDQISLGPLQPGIYVAKVWEQDRGDLNVPYRGPPELTMQATFTVTAATVQVEEFFHSGLNHYFLTGDPFEALHLKANPYLGWSTTGYKFKARHANTPNIDRYSNACRFYGSVAPGPNSHFYTIFTDECVALQALAQSTPPSVPRWNYEGIAFVAALPLLDGSCPSSDPLPLRRFYNQRSLLNDSNHRYAFASIAIDQLIASSWKDEGIAMCVVSAD